LLLAVLLGSALVASAQEPLPQDRLPQDRLPLSRLGDLSLAYTTISRLQTVPGPALRGEVRARAGEAFSVMLPMAASRLTYLRPPGAPITPGDAVVKLEGPDVEHWLTEHQFVAAQLETARQRYESNRQLHENNVLAAGQWADIESRYFELQIRYEHMQHFYELLVEPDAGAPHSGVLLTSPRAGTLLFDSRLTGVSAGGTVFSVIATDGLRVRVDVPTSQAATLSQLSLPGCQLPVDSVGTIAHGFFVTAWSAPLGEGCPQRPGSLVSVTPHYSADALKIPRAALFQWRGEPHVLVLGDDALRAVAVTILADTDDGYAIEANAELAGRDVLSRSVSAVQGILLGLGGE
jgi:hypothetical protein